MSLLTKYLKSKALGQLSILDPSIPLAKYCPIDLSIGNKVLEPLNIQDPNECQTYIDTVLSENNARVAFGGYLEKRDLYSDKSSFGQHEEQRNIHLGIDFWTNAATKVIVPLDGEVHSFQNNMEIGDYGPTIVLKHRYRQFSFHTLYGHLSIASLDQLYMGKKLKRGAVLARLGTPDINVNYAPHLHFQIIEDLQGAKGDYPGVCSSDRLGFYSKNCPDPDLLLKIGRSF